MEPPSWGGGSILYLPYSEMSEANTMSSYPQRWQKGHFHGAYEEAVRQHRRQIRAARSRCRQDGGEQEFQQLINESILRIRDSAMLRCAWDRCRRGGQAPGPNGLTYGDLTGDEVWAEIRQLSDLLGQGAYRPGRDRIVRIPKVNGGVRELRVQDVQDRVAAKAVELVLQPLLDPTFDPHSFGFRPKPDPTMQALEYVERVSREQGRWYWAKSDIAQAFDRVPHRRLLDAIDQRLGSPGLRELLASMIDNRGGRGLRQGSPLSPLLLNLYLDHYLDRPWRQLFPDIPLIRYGDDLLLLGRHRQETADAQGALGRRLVGLGLPLNDNKTRILSVGGSRPKIFPWLGYDLRSDGTNLIARIGRSSWQRLQSRLERLHMEPDPPLRAPSIILGWLNQRGAEFQHESHDRILDRIGRIAHSLGFDELPTRQRLLEVWERSYGRLEAIRSLHRPRPRPQPQRRRDRVRTVPAAELAQVNQVEPPGNA